MKYVLALALLCCSCASLSGITKEAPIDKAANALESTIKSIRSEIQPYAQTAVALCEGQRSDICDELNDGANALETALEHAEMAVQEYRAGKLVLQDAYILVRKALDIATMYAREVLAAHARSRA